MDKSATLPVFWTERALQNAISIKGYLSTNFSLIEVGKLFTILQTFEFAVSAFPKMYPQSTLPN